MKYVVHTEVCFFYMLLMSMAVFSISFEITVANTKTMKLKSASTKFPGAKPISIKTKSTRIIKRYNSILKGENAVLDFIMSGSKILLGAVVATIVILIASSVSFKTTIINNRIILEYIVIPIIISICVNLYKKMELKKIMISTIVCICNFALFNAIANELLYSTSTEIMLFKIAKKSNPRLKIVGLILLSYAVMMLFVDLFEDAFASRMENVALPRNNLVIVLKVNNREIKIRGMYDTGNTLKEPVSLESIHVAGERVGRWLKENLSINNSRMISTYRIVPYNTVCGKGIMDTMCVDEMRIIDGKRQSIISNARIGLVNGEVSSNCSFDILLNSSIDLDN